MNQDLVINGTIRIAASEMQWQFSRSSGPGGQNVNKVNSKATLRWNVDASQAIGPVAMQRLKLLAANRITTEGELLLSCDEYRDQPRNAARCMQKLRELILQAMKTPRKRLPTKPTHGSQKRRLQDKKINGEKKSSRRYSSGE